MATERKHYIIGFIYADNGQPFSTEADLSDNELARLQIQLSKLESDGLIEHLWVRVPGEPIHQTYSQVVREIKAAVRS